MKPQAVTSSPGNNAIFMIYQLLPTKIEIAKTSIKNLLSYYSSVINSMKIREPEKDVSVVIGFGANAWQNLFSEQPTPKELVEFEPVVGDKYTAPATKGDLFIHIRAKEMGICFELAQIFTSFLKTSFESVDEIHGFRYFDGRAIIGFVDGTENPVDKEAEIAGIIGEEDPYFVGGSYAFTQKYLHNMDAWNNLKTEVQEKVIGRNKYNDVELSEEEKFKNAHNIISKATNDEGEEMKIVRANVPFANPSKNEYGTFFIGYARYFSVTHQMLEQMFIGNPAGNYDKLLDYSTAVSGNLFFIPSVDLIDQLAE